MKNLVATATLFFSVVSIVQAQIILNPPPDYHSWIFHGATYCSPEGANGYPACAGSATGELSIENRALSQWEVLGINHVGGGTITPNQMKAYSSSNSSFHRVSTAIRDTYTLSGPAGDVLIGVSLAADAESMRFPAYNGALGGQPVGGGTLSVAIARDIAHDGRTLVNHLASASDDLPQGRGTLSKILQAEATTQFSVSANVPFTLGFLMSLSTTNSAEIDARGTSVIGFDFPAGYELTSELGWTAVPEPDTVALCMAVCSVLSVLSRRRIILLDPAGELSSDVRRGGVKEPSLRVMQFAQPYSDSCSI